MIDRDRAVDDVKKNNRRIIMYLCTELIHACLVLIAVMVPLESHFSRQYAPFCLMDINLLENDKYRIHKSQVNLNRRSFLSIFLIDI